MPIPDLDDVPDSGNGLAGHAARIDKRLGAIEKTEHERAGAARLMTWFIASFGSLETAAVLALAGML